MFVVPTTTAPAASSATTDGALPELVTSSRPAEPHVFGTPATSMQSLIATGTPKSGSPAASPRARASSRTLARVIAASAVTEMKARLLSFSASIRPRVSLISSQIEMRPACVDVTSSDRGGSEAVIRRPTWRSRHADGAAGCRERPSAAPLVPPSRQPEMRRRPRPQVDGDRVHPQAAALLRSQIRSLSVPQHDPSEAGVL